MTETITSSPNSTAAAHVDVAPNGALPDLRPSFDTVVDLARTVIDAIGPDDLRRSTPCSDYDLGQLASHLVAVIQRVAAVGRHEDPWSVPQEAAGLEPSGFTAAWDAAVADQRSVWADDSVLGATLVLPFGEFPGAVAIATYIGEVLVHTWDLASSLGIEVDWPTEIVERAVMGAKMKLPEEGRGEYIPFDPVVPTAEDAPAIDRLVAWMGRRP
ncbi:MAG: TIGR03086 family metal-binding protein [Acidimicrobiales bacterium]